MEQYVWTENQKKLWNDIPDDKLYVLINNNYQFLKMKVLEVRMHYSDNIGKLTLRQLDERFNYCRYKELKNQLMHCQDEETAKKIQTELESIIRNEFNFKKTKREYFDEFKKHITN